MNTIIQRWASQIAEHAANGTLVRFMALVLRKLVFWLATIYFLLIALAWVVFTWVGEQNITTAFLLFVPPSVWLLPLVALLPLALVFNWRCLAALLLMATGVIWGWLDWRYSLAANKGADGLSVMTYNRGQSRNQSLQPFKQATRPDILLMQDASNRIEGYLHAREYEEFEFGASAGEHLILSKYPIKESGILPPASAARPSRVARFVIEWQGRQISIYSVHLMTPRDALRAASRGAFLWGVLALPGTPMVAKRQHYQEFWDGQVIDAQELLRVVRADPRPSIVAGDFNSPHLGNIHRMITQDLGDSHEEAGSGFGFTFPGDTKNPLSFGGPWLRIDYVFHDRRWRAVNCITEKDRASQHRAVVARLCPLE